MHSLLEKSKPQSAARRQKTGLGRFDAKVPSHCVAYLAHVVNTINAKCSPPTENWFRTVWDNNTETEMV